jgi:mannose-1-phosphate guanylyltransferase/mannose-6-phosphate isomerase
VSTEIPHLHAVILAGGSGQRFWPLSRELNPKQLLSVFGTESLITLAVQRIAPFVEAESSSIRVMTNERLFDELRNHLASQSSLRHVPVGYLVEPIPRNTGPALALTAATIAAEDPDGVMVVLPSDHLLDDGQEWADAIQAGVCAARMGFLVTFGVRPTRPETGYGYIRAGEVLQECSVGSAEARRVEAFVEKPDRERAVEFVSSGTMLWNAGIFVMKASHVLDELRGLGGEASAIAQTARWVSASMSDPALAEEARERFGALPAVSIDKLLMERSSNVAVVPVSLTWSDVGSLLSLGEVLATDGDGNARSGRGVDIDSANNIIFSTEGLVATLGVEDLIIVDTPDATLVASKDRAQDVRLVFEALKAAGAEEVVQSKVSLRPWGSWTALLRGPGFVIKLLEVKSGSKLSLQRHHHRSEHWVVVSGTARVTRETETMEVHVNESAFIPAGCVHRLENCGKVPLQVIEVQVGEYLGEDDIIRLHDDWNRDVR